MRRNCRRSLGKSERTDWGRPNLLQGDPRFEESKSGDAHRSVFLTTWQEAVPREKPAFQKYEQISSKGGNYYHGGRRVFAGMAAVGREGEKGEREFSPWKRKRECPFAKNINLLF